jgi:glutamate carboxypeptidase
MDTVFELSSPFQKWTVKSKDIASGPGSSDMKGGLVVMLYALKALNQAGALNGASITVVLSGDEESPGEPLSISRRDMIEAARHSDAAIEFEGGSRTDGREFATIARRSSSTWRLRTTGVEAHSSGIFSPRTGSGAIYEMARILSSFEAQLKEPDLTFNVGIVLGGAKVDFDPLKYSGSASGKSNIISPTATAAGDIRTVSDEQLQRVRGKMKQIIANHLPQTSAEIVFEDKYPSMTATEGNKALLKVLNGINRDLNMEEMEALPPGKRGAGDVSFVAPLVDSISGFGSNGGGAHAPGETIDLSRQPIQTERAALFI